MNGAGGCMPVAGHPMRPPTHPREVAYSTRARVSINVACRSMWRVDQVNLADLHHSHGSLSAAMWYYEAAAATCCTSVLRMRRIEVYRHEAVRSGSAVPCASQPPPGLARQDRAFALIHTSSHTSRNGHFTISLISLHSLVHARFASLHMCHAPCVYRAVPPLWSDHVGFILVVNHLVLTQLGSDMSLDVFLSFRICSESPITPPFHFGTPIA